MCRSGSLAARRSIRRYRSRPDRAHREAESEILFGTGHPAHRHTRIVERAEALHAATASTSSRSSAPARKGKQFGRKAVIRLCTSLCRHSTRTMRSSAMPRRVRCARGRRVSSRNHDRVCQARSNHVDLRFHAASCSMHSVRERKRISCPPSISASKVRHSFTGMQDWRRPPPVISTRGKTRKSTLSHAIRGLHIELRFNDSAPAPGSPERRSISARRPRSRSGVLPHGTLRCRQQAQPPRPCRRGRLMRTGAESDRSPCRTWTAGRACGLERRAAPLAPKRLRLHGFAPMYGELRFKRCTSGLQIRRVDQPTIWPPPDLRT